MSDTKSNETAARKHRAISPTRSATAKERKASGPASAAPGRTATARASTSSSKSCRSTAGSPSASPPKRKTDQPGGPEKPAHSPKGITPCTSTLNSRQPPRSHRRIDELTPVLVRASTPNSRNWNANSRNFASFRLRIGGRHELSNARHNRKHRRCEFRGCSMGRSRCSHQRRFILRQRWPLWLPAVRLVGIRRSLKQLLAETLIGTGLLHPASRPAFPTSRREPRRSTCLGKIARNSTRSGDRSAASVEALRLGTRLQSSVIPMTR